MLRRSLTLLILTLVGTMMGGPAFADPAGPTNYRSTLTGVQTPDGAPTETDLDVDILGGDAFLVARAPAGEVVEIPGYDGEPYVRIEADGSVQVNQRSPARWLNDARFGEQDVEVPAGADAAAPPTWELVARGGEYAWHDHRIHFMSPTLPSSVDPGATEPQPVMDWEVPVTVDGEPIVLTGELSWVPGPGPVVPVGAIVVALGVIGVIVVRRREAIAPLIGVVTVLTAAVGVAKSLGLPAGADGEPALLVLPGMALTALVAGEAVRRRGDARGAWLRDAAGIPVGVWGVLQFGSLTRPIVPGPIPVEAVRGVTAVALALGVVAVMSLGRRLLEATRLDDGTGDDGEDSPAVPPSVTDSAGSTPEEPARPVDPEHR